MNPLKSDLVTALRQRNQDSKAAGMKACSTCGHTKPLEAFPFRKDRGAHAAQCRECLNARIRNSYDPQRGRAYCQRYRSEHPEKIKQKNDRRDRKRMADMAREARRRDLEASRLRQREERRAAADRLLPWYVAKTLGMSAADIPKHIYEIKRDQLSLRRIAKSMQQAVNRVKETQ